MPIAEAYLPCSKESPSQSTLAIRIAPPRRREQILSSPWLIQTSSLISSLSLLGQMSTRWSLTSSMTTSWEQITRSCTLLPRYSVSVTPANSGSVPKHYPSAKALHMASTTFSPSPILQATVPSNSTRKIRI